MSDPLYMIWSNEHRAWWRPNSMGYTFDAKGAGVYLRGEAIAICKNANRFLEGQAPNEIPVPVSDWLEVRP